MNVIQDSPGFVKSTFTIHRSKKALITNGIFVKPNVVYSKFGHPALSSEF